MGANDERSYAEMKSTVMDILRRSFRPEFLNRIDEIVVFHSLSRENIMDITRLQLSYLAKRIRERGITLEFTDRAISFLAEKGYDVNFGARPLKRVIQNLVETPLAKEIIKGNFAEGDTIVVNVEGEGLIFKKK
jgi:ATP-dependent Clp protease ATP-binding subunit ClpB